MDCRLARDKKTGKPRGFAFLAYEDQRSTVLAVDNLNGIELCGRTIMVDHVKQYKIPREFMQLSDHDDSDDEKKKRKESKGGDDEEEKKEEESSSSEDDEVKEAKAKERWEKKLYKPTGPDGQGWGDFRN